MLSCQNIKYLQERAKAILQGPVLHTKNQEDQNHEVVQAGRAIVFAWCLLCSQKAGCQGIKTCKNRKETMYLV